MKATIQSRVNLADPKKAGSPWIHPWSIFTFELNKAKGEEEEARKESIGVKGWTWPEAIIRKNFSYGSEVAIRIALAAKGGERGSKEVLLSRSKLIEKPGERKKTARFSDGGRKRERER